MRAPLHTTTAGFALIALASSGRSQVVPSWTDQHSGNVAGSDRTYVAGLEAHPHGGVVAVCEVSALVLVFPTTVFAPVRSQLVRWSDGGQKLWVRDLAGPARLFAVDAHGVSYVLGSKVEAISAAGDVVWQADFPAGVGLTDLTLAPSGRVHAAGTSGGDWYVATWSSSGAFLWGRTIDGPLSGSDDGVRVECAENGDVLAAGRFSWFVGGAYDSDVGVARLDAAGNVLWVRSVGSTPQRYESGQDLAVFPDGEVAVAGISLPLSGNDRSVYLARLDASGVLRWSTTWSLPIPRNHFVQALATDPDGSTRTLVWSYNGLESGTHLLHHASDGSLVGSMQDGPRVQNAYAAGIARGAAGQSFVLSTTWGDPQQSPFEHDGLVRQVDLSSTVNWDVAFESTNPEPEEWFTDVALAGSRVVVGGTNSRLDGFTAGGVAQVLAFDVSNSPDGYCEGKTNSLGCTPYLVFTGLPSATASSGFVIQALQERNRCRGMFVYGTNGGARVPFAGGLRCVAAPIRRTPAQTSAGSALPAADCTGSFTIDWNAFAHGLAGGNPDPILTSPGTTIWLQAVARDPGFAPPDDWSLSNGLRFVVLP